MLFLFGKRTWYLVNQEGEKSKYTKQKARYVVFAHKCHACVLKVSRLGRSQELDRGVINNIFIVTFKEIMKVLQVVLK